MKSVFVCVLMCCEIPNVVVKSLVVVGHFLKITVALCLVKYKLGYRFRILWLVIHGLLYRVQI